MGLFQMIQNVDVVIYQFLNGFAGNPHLDYFASFEETNMLLRGAIFVAMYWYFWFAKVPQRDGRRKTIVVIIFGTLLAVVTSRIIADLAPYRLRPMYDPHIQHHAYAFPMSYYLVDWSGFPSDCATYFFALAYGLARLSRRIAIPAMLYAAVWICLPRMFLGEHYASDIVVGAMIGIAVVWASLKIGWLQTTFASLLLSVADAHPGVFYAAAFAGAFEMGVIFEDLRVVARAVFDIARAEHRAFIDACVLATLALVAIAAYSHHIRSKPVPSPKIALCSSQDLPAQHHGRKAA